MSEKAITIYTPASAEPHITADDDAFIYHSLCKGKSCILGSLVCTNADENIISLSGGGVSNQGYILRIPEGETIDFTVPGGTVGLKRHDLLIAEFTKGGGEIADTHVFKLISGTASASPSDPSIFTASLLNPGAINQFALFRIVLDGSSISHIEQLAPTIEGSTRKITTSSTAPANPSAGDIWFVTE